MEDSSNQNTETTFKKYIPLVTALCCLISIAVFIGISLEPDVNSWDAYKKWGSPSATDIFNGDYWGLITSNFLHVEAWHIAFNLFWLWHFGKKIEFESNKLFYVFLIFSAALVSSLAQLAFSDSTGIGLSGIGYALFGFLFVKGKTSEEYKDYLDKKTIYLFLFWLMLCVVLTKAGLWTVGNAAHIGGLLWGAMIAFFTRYRMYMQWAAGSVFLAILFILVLYSPFSTAYLSHQAYDLHKNQKLEEASKLYQKILKGDPNNEFARVNLKQLEVQQLEQKAYDLHAQLKYNEARQVYNQILAIDTGNQWAKDNLSKLPREN